MSEDRGVRQQAPAPAVTPPVSHLEHPATRPRKRRDAPSTVGVPLLESSGSRLGRRVHRFRLYVSAFSAVAVLAYVVGFAASNTARVHVDWVFGKSSVSLIWLVLIVAVLGWLGGLLLAAAFGWRTRAPKRRKRRRAASSEARR
jgi:uncharacterized integral membrane protein